MVDSPALLKGGVTLPTTRKIEEILKQAQVDPRVIAIVVGLAERQRVQHQQIYGLVELFGRMQDLMKIIDQKIGVKDDNLKKLGIEDMMKDFRSGKNAMVESVEEFDQQPVGGEASESRKKS